MFSVPPFQAGHKGNHMALSAKHLWILSVKELSRGHLAQTCNLAIGLTEGSCIWLCKLCIVYGESFTLQSKWMVFPGLCWARALGQWCKEVSLHRGQPPRVQANERRGLVDYRKWPELTIPPCNHAPCRVTLQLLSSRGRPVFSLLESELAGETWQKWRVLVPSPELKRPCIFSNPLGLYLHPENKPRAY